MPVLDVCPQCHAQWETGRIYPKPARERADAAFGVFVFGLLTSLWLAWHFTGRWPGLNGGTLAACLLAIALAVLSFSHYVGGCLITAALFVWAIILAIF
jgi:hypothetical protein